MTQSLRAVVVGAGSWGTAFACLLRDRGHEVTIAARDGAQADAINATGRNPRYAQAADLENALVKLYKDNASTLTPDPLHSAFYDSHPPAATRIARLRTA